MPDGNNRWYTKGEGEEESPKVTITANSSLGEKLCYVISGKMDEENDPEPNKIEIINKTASKEIEITEVGYTRITAWIEGDGEKSSKEVTEIIKFDNTAPYITVDKLEPKAEYGNNGWIISNAEVKIEAEDTGSGVMGYTYEVYQIEEGTSPKKIKESKTVIDKDVPIKIETDGEYSILVTLIDNTGKNKKVETIEIKKDRKSTRHRCNTNRPKHNIIK